MFFLSKKEKALVAYCEYYLVLLITCCPGLKCLDILEFFPYKVVNSHLFYLLSAAIRCNKNLEFLGLHENRSLRLYEANFELIATGIGLNRSLKKVSLMKSINDKTLLSLVKILHNCGSVLKGVAVEIWPNNEILTALTEMNTIRVFSSRPMLLLFVHDYIDEHNEGSYKVTNGPVFCPYSPEFDNYIHEL